MEQDIVMAYINDLGYFADTATNTLSHAHKPVRESQGTVPHDRKKPNMQHKYDASIQMDVITTEDIIALDGKDPTIQQIQARLASRGPDTLQQTLSAQVSPVGTYVPKKRTSPPYVSLPTIGHNTDRPGLAQSSRYMAPDQYGRRIADDAHWTKISRKLVSVEVLQQAGVRYEARPDYVAILGILSRDQVAKLVRESEATITSRPPPPYLQDGSSSGQGHPVLADIDDEEISFIPLIEGDDKGNSAIRTHRSWTTKTRHSDVAWYSPRKEAEKKQEKPRSTQEVLYGTQFNGPVISTKGNPYRGYNGRFWLQHSVGAYDKDVPGGIVGIGSAAVSLLSVLSEAASAI